MTPEGQDAADEASMPILEFEKSSSSCCMQPTETLGGHHDEADEADCMRLLTAVSIRFPQYLTADCQQTEGDW